MDHIPPTEGIPAAICVRLLTQGQEGNNDYARGKRDHPTGSRRLRYPKAPTSHHHAVGRHATVGTRPRLPANDAVPPAMPGRPQRCHFCVCLWHHDPHSSSLGGGAALELRTDTAGRLHQHQLTGATISGASFHGELKTLAIIPHTVNDTNQQPQDHAHHVWVVVDAAVDFQIIRKLARQPLHKATDSSLGTEALHLWAALRRFP